MDRRGVGVAARRRVHAQRPSGEAVHEELHHARDVLEFHGVRRGGVRHEAPRLLEDLAAAMQAFAVVGVHRVDDPLFGGAACRARRARRAPPRRTGYASSMFVRAMTVSQCSTKSCSGARERAMPCASGAAVRRAESTGSSRRSSSDFDLVRAGAARSTRASRVRRARRRAHSPRAASRDRR